MRAEPGPVCLVHYWPQLRLLPGCAGRAHEGEPHCKCSPLKEHLGGEHLGVTSCFEDPVQLVIGVCPGKSALCLWRSPCASISLKLGIIIPVCPKEIRESSCF